MPQSAVILEHVSCQLGRIRALDGLSLSVAEGRVLGIVGPNGAGKTTLIDVICGLIRPSEGRVTVFGHDVAREAQRVRRELGVVPQETALYEEVSARDNLRFAAALFDVAKADARIEEVLGIVGLAARARDPVRTLSGGMQRRLAIARALLHDPRMLVLDEPTLGVDVEARHQIWAHIRTLRASGKTVLLATNYLDEAEALCDRIVILRAGKLVADDTPAGLIARAGRCVELECPAEEVDRLDAALRTKAGILRTEITGLGLTVYMDGRCVPEDVVRESMQLTPLLGFRVRSPDLVEVFRSLGDGHEGRAP